MAGSNQFVVVANRLPVDLLRMEEGQPVWAPSPGGLVSALSPVLVKHSGCWVGWPGIADLPCDPFTTDSGILLHPINLTANEYEDFYEGFSNATLWPLYHDLIMAPQYHRHWWESYREVNLKFANAVAEVAATGGVVWVQDYQLQLVPGILRQLRPDLTIGFFLHIPFPPADLFRQLPWREEIVRGLLGADLLGFQSKAGADNFLALAKQVAGELGSAIGQPDRLTIAGEASTRAVTATIQAPDGRTVGVGSFPISIDYEQVHKLVSDQGAQEIRESLGNPKLILLGVDRLDYTKGILQRLVAFEELLETGALTEATLVQIATPSRERVQHYRQTRSLVEEAVGRINGRFGTVGHPVVHYSHHSLPLHELVHYYRAADVMLVTPFKDGMNLVAKEYVACHADGTGALVLSEFAGSAAELNRAYLCNPHDIESVKRAVLTAANAVMNHDPSTTERMNALVEQVSTHDVDLWAKSFLDQLAAASWVKQRQ